MKQRRKNSSPILMWGTVAALALSLFAICGEQGLLKLRSMQKLDHRLDREISELTKRNETLAHDIEQLKDPTYLEKIVRKELGYLRPNEVIYYFDSDRL